MPPELMSGGSYGDNDPPPPADEPGPAGGVIG